ncbi:MAG: carboxypeptidase-like regulatory domain-containing protein [Tannerella sp.]|nr:carboxypeptidase-like regulatory domain-containing protein [Tannerella sp.]
MLITLSFHCIYAQQSQPGIILGGQVRSVETKEILPFANVRLDGTATYITISDDNGEFRLSNVPPGDYLITCSYLGYRKWEKRLTISASRHLTIELDAGNVLREVVVTATESKGMASASRIDREAMSHLQPTSFTDLLELLPGNISQDPNMGAANTIQLRETGNLSANGDKYIAPDYAISSLGTLFLIDGAPLNTDANLQYNPGTGAGTPDYNRNTVNRGVDMRAISTDNIESVEIVRGIPSAEYGNLTSGLVNIQTIRKAGKLTARFKADGYSKLFAAGKGFNVPGKDLLVNIDAGFLNAKTDPRNNLENYKRLNASLRTTWTFKNHRRILKWTSNIDCTASIDDVKDDPDVNYGGINEYKSAYNLLKATNNLRWSFLNVDFIKSLELNSSISAQFDRLEQRKLVAPTRYGLAPTAEGAGEHDAQLLFSEYIADFLCDGKPLNAFLKLKGDLSFRPANIRNDVKLGGEWNYSKNFGNGQVYDLSHPITTTGWHHRPRAYHDIPALQNLSFFAEDYISAKAGSHTLEVQAGLRSIAQLGMDSRYLLQAKPYLDPRVNLRWTFPAIPIGHRSLLFALAAGGGKTTKMPTLSYLYPEPVYTDITQLAYYDARHPTAYSRFNVLTCISDATNYRLAPARNTKQEIRMEITCGNNRLSVAGFVEDMTSGFRFSSAYRAFGYKDYDESAIVSADLNAPPALEGLPYENKKRLSGYSFAENGSRLKKEGFEFQFNSQRIQPLRTAITVSGAWFRSTYTNSRPMFETVSTIINNQTLSHSYVGLYEWDDGRVNQQFNTNFMFDTQVPEWGFIFSASVQCMWYIRTQSVYKQGIPTAYLDVNDEQLHPYTETDRTDTYLQHLVKNFQEDAFIRNEIPVACYVNLKATKKIDRFLELALFVNRLFDYTPDYTTNGFVRRRNVDAYFGMEMNFKL